MEKGFFDQTYSEWIVPIADRRGKRLDLKKGRIHTARSKFDNREKK